MKDRRIFLEGGEGNKPKSAVEMRGNADASQKHERATRRGGGTEQNINKIWVCHCLLSSSRKTFVLLWRLYCKKTLFLKNKKK